MITMEKYIYQAQFCCNPIKDYKNKIYGAFAQYKYTV